MLTVMVSHHHNPLDIEKSAPERLEEVFVGFTAESESSVWNETNWPQNAMPGGFDFLSVYDYSDVGVLINNNSEAVSYTHLTLPTT